MHEKGQLIRLGPWHGVILEMLHNANGDKFARIKLLKHRINITEIQSVNNLTHCSLESLENEYLMRIAIEMETFNAIKEVARSFV